MKEDKCHNCLTIENGDCAIKNDCVHCDELNLKKEIERRDFRKFSRAAKEYVYKHGTPHSTIVITQVGIEISDGRMAESFIRPKTDDKQTPKKLVSERVEYEDVLVCPACYSREPVLNESKYCGDCGQAILRT